MKSSNSCTGFTLFELLISLSLTGILFSSITIFFMDTTRRAADQKVVVTAQSIASDTASLILGELRNVGIGMPNGQANFKPTSPGVGPVAMPLLTSSSEDFIEFRYSDSGHVINLSSPYDPGSGSLVIEVNQTQGLAAGQVIYLSNMTVGGEDGMRATIQSISSNQVSISPSFEVSTGAVFAAGSILSRVNEISYDGSDIDSGVVRISDGNSLLVAPRTEFETDYLDSDGNTIALPLSSAQVEQSLAAVRLRVRTRASRRLSTGEDYIAEVQQTVGLRNLRFLR